MAEHRSKAVTGARRPEQTLDERFDEVSVAIAEMRDFTSFCFDRLGRDLRAEMAALGTSLGSRIDAVDTKVGAVGVSLGSRIDAVDAKVDAVDAKVGALGTSLGSRIDAVDAKVDAFGKSLGSRIDAVDRRLGRHELVLSEILNEVKILSSR